LFIEIINESTKNIIIGTVYRPPNSKFNEFEHHLKDILSKTDKGNKPCYLIGDFNIDLLKYHKCNFSNQFFNQLSSSGYMPLIIKPTRITRSTATLIDYIFTNQIHQTEHLNGILFNDISDHLPIFSVTNYGTQTKCNTSDTMSYTTRIITNSSLESFANELQSCNWKSTLSQNDPTVSYKIFYSKFFGIYDQHFPIKKIKNKNRINNFWISKGLKKYMKTKENLYKKLLKSPSGKNEGKYKS